MRLDELRRFVIDVPRYTSYPTAADFSPAIDADVHAANLRARARREAAPLALYVHLPFCKELCHFCGCHALIARTPERMERYLGALVREAELVAEALGDARDVAELHFGGGSPSLLSADELERLVGDLRARFRFAGDAAISLEADPRTTDAEKLARYRALGVGRISFGFQDLDAGVQRAIGRNQSAAVSLAAFEGARAAGFEGINVDLCYGLPEQTEATFAATLEAIVLARPDRVALFGYAHVPWLRPNQKLIVASSLPGPETRLRLVAMGHERLTAAGYASIGFDHFALPGDPLARAAAAGTLHRNFQGYTTTRTDALVGLGLSAISDLPEAYAQNARTLREYYAAVDAGRLPTERGVARTAEDHLRGDVIRELMCSFRLEPARVEERHGVDFAATFAAELRALAALEDDGLVKLRPDAVELTPLGRLFVRNVAVVFDAHRARPRPGGPRFSASV